MNRRYRANSAAIAVLAAIAMCAAACSSSGTSSTSKNSALTASAPGITPTQILIGSHQPLTGVAAPGYGEIAPASNAYFRYINTHGGIYGRKIKYTYLNDQYNPSITTTVVHQLVLQDNVFAIFEGLGTPTNLAVVPFLNSEKVPDVFVQSGCECWNAPSKDPYTFGWQLDYIREGKILGKYIEQHFKNDKIGFFLQDDEFGGDGAKGLEDEIPASQIVAKETYDPSNVKIGPQVAALKAAGAQVVVSFSVPAFTALLKLGMLGLKYSPQLVVSDVGSEPSIVGGMLASFAKNTKSGFGDSLTQGIITDSFLPALSDTSNSWIKLFTKIHNQYLPKVPLDGFGLTGMAVAYSFVQAMFKAGRNPTRQDLVNAINSGLSQGASVSPFTTSPTDHDGMTGAFMAEIKNGALIQIGPVQVTNASPNGPITTYSGAQPPAPASGIPSP